MEHRRKTIKLKLYHFVLLLRHPGYRGRPQSEPDILNNCIESPMYIDLEIPHLEMRITHSCETLNICSLRP